MKRLYADIGLLSVAFIWGVTFPVVKIALESISPFAFNTLRFSLAALLFLPFIKFSREDFAIGIKIGIAVFLGYAFQTVGLEYPTATNTGFITSMYVVFTPVIAALLYRVKIGTREIVSILLAFSGLFLLSGFNGDINPGDVLALLCAIAFAFEIAMISHYSKISNPTMLAFGQIVAVAVFSAPLSAISTTRFALNTDVVYALVITAVFATVIAKLLQNWLQKYTKPSDAAVIFSMEGVFAHLCAVIMLGESLSLQQYIGAFLIVFAVILVSLSSSNET